MRVHQPGGHLMRARGAEVDDWSWRATVRRIATLARLTAPYKARTALAIFFLLARDGDRARAAVPRRSSRSTTASTSSDLHGAVAGSSRCSSLAGLATSATSARADVLHGLDGRAHPRRPAQQALPPPAAALARLLRAQPRRRDHQPAHERRRGARPARDGRRHELVQNTLMLVGTAIILFFLDWRLALATLTILPLLVDRDGAVPQALGARVPRRCASGSASSRRRSPRTSPACASSRRSRARTQQRAELPRGQRALPRGEPADGRPERPLLPVRRLPLRRRDRDRARLRRLPRRSTAT